MFHEKLPMMKRIVLFAVLFCTTPLLIAEELTKPTFFVGTARGDITPPKIVPLWGQFDLRLSQGIETPLTVNVVALESARSSERIDSVIFVSTDLLLVNDDLIEVVRQKVTAKEASIDVNKMVANATHPHTAPTTSLTASTLPVADTIMDYPEVIEFMAERIADAVVAAWKNRKPGKIAFGLDFAVVGWNRRAVYADGRAVMYGNTNQPDFRGIEAMEDYDIGSLFFLDAEDQLLAIAINVACPAQVVEGRNTINADFWHPVRETLARRFGNDVVILGWCGASGDIAPRPIYRNAAIDRMNSLRQLDEMQEIARKIDRAVADTWGAVHTTASAEVPLVHRVETLQLPMRRVTEAEYAQAKTECERIAAALRANPGKAPAEVDWMAGGWHGSVVKRYEAQQQNPEVRFSTQIHVIRIGETAIFTSPFELFTDFGVQMKARSPATQTFVIQLASGGKEIGLYIPTERAVRGGGYSAIIQSTPVGPEGGQVLVEATLQQANELFPKP